jgi:hypothetical protein
MSVKVTVPNTSSDSVVFGSANTPTAAEVVGIDSGSSNGQLAFKTTASGTSTERMRIDANGNVGIGTSSPSQKIDVNGNVNATNHISVVGGTTYRGVAGGVESQIKNPITTGSTADLAFYTHTGSAQPERMRIDSSGNVGIGTSSPGSTGKFVVDFVGDGSKFGAFLSSSVGMQSYGAYATSHVRMTYPSVADWDLLANSGGALTFSRNSTERMRIDANGNVLVGATSSFGNGKLQVAGSAAENISVKPGSNNYYMGFYNSAGNSVLGSISTNGSTTSFNTSSDYRLKENIAPMTGALDTVAKLNPVTYKWKLDGSDGQGFIAHELQSVVPDCVTGEKDAVDAEGNPVYQGIDTSFLVATLTAAIKELKQELDTVKAELTALKA